MISHPLLVDNANRTVEDVYKKIIPQIEEARKTIDRRRDELKQYVSRRGDAYWDDFEDEVANGGEGGESSR